jgi:Zn-dependent M28 family amino/carboxypeptidase
MGSNGFEQPFEQGVNLAGRIAGNDPLLGDEYVVVSGHYDHLGVVGAPRSQCRASARAPGDTICNGAADNAAGSVATLAVANALAHSRLGTRRSILIVFWDAEEDGLLGSRYFADQEPLVPLEQIVAMYSVDNVGGYIIQGVEDSFAIGTEYATGLREKVAAVNTETGFTQWPVSSFFVGSDTGGRSDHLPFRLHGVPIIFFGSGSPPEYHTPADEIDVVSIDKLEQIARHVTLMTADVANDEGRPAFVDAPSPQLDDARALLALGRVVRADPAALGLDDPVLIAVLDGWITRLERYIANPPTTDAGWNAYLDFVKEIITIVYSVIGGEA